MSGYREASLVYAPPARILMNTNPVCRRSSGRHQALRLLDGLARCMLGLINAPHLRRAPHVMSCSSVCHDSIPSAMAECRGRPP